MVLETEEQLLLEVIRLTRIKNGRPDGSITQPVWVQVGGDGGETALVNLLRLVDTSIGTIQRLLSANVTDVEGWLDEYAESARLASKFSAIVNPAQASSDERSDWTGAAQ